MPRLPIDAMTATARSTRCGIERGRRVGRLPPAGWQQYALILGTSALPRLLYAYLRPPLDPDWGHYWRMSSSLLHQGVLGFGGRPSTILEPLYPLFLALSRHLFGDHLFLVLAVQAMVGSVGAIYLYELTRTLARDATTAAVAVGIYAFYPYLIGQTAALEEVTFFTTLLIACCFHYSKADHAAHALACGVAFGLTMLTRTTAAPILALAVMILAIRRRFASALTIGGIAVLVFLPYAVRNYRIDGSVMPTRGGANLLEANCKYADKVIPTYTVDVLEPYLGDLIEKEMPSFGTATERDIDRFFFSHAVAFMRANPLRVVALWARNAFYLFYPRLVPFHPVGPTTTTRFTGDDGITVEHAANRALVEEVAYSLSYTPLLLTALVGVYVRRRYVQRDLILYVTLFSFVVVYSIYWPATRVRAPMDFVLMFYCACAITGVVREQTIR